MEVIILSMAVYWLLLLFIWWRVNSGLGMFSEVAKELSSFMMEKALGPGASLVEGRDASAARVWLFTGAVWSFVGASLLFVEKWLQHSPTALHSLESWGWSATTSSLYLAGDAAFVYGGLASLLIAGGLHVVPRMSSVGLASEVNAHLMAYVWSMAVLLHVVASQFSSELASLLGFIAFALLFVAQLAIFVNLLLTVAERDSKLAAPQCFIILGHGSYFAAFGSFIVLGPGVASITYWVMVQQMISGFFLGSAFGLALYAVSRGTRRPIWSGSLVGIALLMTFVSVTPMAFDVANASYAAFTFGIMGLGVTMPVLGDVSRIAFAMFLALSLIPAIAMSTNLLATLRRNPVAAATSPGLPLIGFGAFMLPIVAAASLFGVVDAFGGSGELTGILDSMHTIAMVTVFTPLILGAAISLYPDIVGRTPDFTAGKESWIYWGIVVGGIGGGAVLLMGDFSAAAFLEAGGEEMTSTVAHDLMTFGSILFYGVVLALLANALSMIRGVFEGTPVGVAPLLDATGGPPRYLVAGDTSVRDLLTAGVSLDTMLVIEQQDDDPGSATLLVEEE